MGAFVPGTQTARGNLSAQVEQEVPTPISPDEISLSHPTQDNNVISSALPLEHTGLIGFQLTGPLTYAPESGTYSADAMLHYEDGGRTRFSEFPLVVTDAFTAEQLSSLGNHRESELRKLSYAA
jgi:hypothetical protein